MLFQKNFGLFFGPLTPSEWSGYGYFLEMHIASLSSPYDPGKDDASIAGC